MELVQNEPRRPEGKVISQIRVKAYQDRLYRLTTVTPTIPDATIKTVIVDQDGLDEILENYGEYAEFIVELVTYRWWHKLIDALLGRKRAQWDGDSRSRLCWTCSTHHEHRFRWIARLCELRQRLRQRTLILRMWVSFKISMVRLQGEYLMAKLAKKE